MHVYDVGKYFYGLGGGVRQSIGYQELKDMPIPIPPRDEQDRIVDFVDTKCSTMADEIDVLVTKLKREIALLGQYKNQMSADIITGRTDLELISYSNHGSINFDGDDDEDISELEV